MDTSVFLDQLTWPEIKAQIEGGRTTVVVPFGSTEQHGRHLPLATDSLLGDYCGLAVAERLDAFVAPTVRIGCSEHHLAFAGSMSVSEATFEAVAKDVVDSLSRHGFERIILLPTHGGNFAPLARAAAAMTPPEGVKVVAVTDLMGFTQRLLGLGVEMGVTPGQGGAHAGEWETSMILALRPELVKADKAVPGYTGPLEEAVAKVFDGIQAVDENGVIGDPTPATAANGRAYLEAMVEFCLEAIGKA